MTSRLIALLFLLPLGVTTVSPLHAQHTPIGEDRPTTPAGSDGHAGVTEHDAVVAAVQEFLRAMTDRDVEASRRVMLEQGQYFSVRPGPEGLELRRVAHEQYFEMLGRLDAILVERIWDPTVLVDENVALLWTPYDIFGDGEFMHCGVDAFSLVRTQSEWRIASIVYTVEPDGCEPSPLGAEAPPQLGLVAASERRDQDPDAQAVREQILATAHEVLRAMAEGDVESSRALMLAEGQGFSVRGRDGDFRLARQTNQEYFAWLEQNEQAVHERLWGEVVLGHGPIAAVWAPYDFHLDGAFSHCGVNVVSLVKVDSRWQVADWVWNEREEGCAPSPLGPLAPETQR